jgi:hypothetical protein
LRQGRPLPKQLPGFCATQGAVHRG